jgi:hypothetical protein
LLKKTITYTNPFTDEEVTEDHYFHISKADLVEMEMEEHKAEYTSKNGEKLTGLQAKLQKIVDSEDGKAIIAEFKDIIRRAYGKKDGDRFLKSKEIWEEFSSTEAYSQLIFEVCTDAKVSGEFINGIIPNNLEQIAKEIREQAGRRNHPRSPRWRRWHTIRVRSSQVMKPFRQRRPWRWSLPRRIPRVSPDTKLRESSPTPKWQRWTQPN